MNIKRFKNFINEGLISTVEFTKAAHIISRWCNKNIKNPVDVYTNDDNHHLVVEIEVKKNSRLSDNELGFVKELETLGYYLSVAKSDDDILKPTPEKPTINIDDIKKTIKKWNKGMADYDIDDYNQYRFMFEPIFQKQVGKDKKFLYHIANGNTVDKIMKIGLVPKSKSKLTFHPDRVYFGELTMMDGFYTIYKPYVKDATLLKVDVSDLTLAYDWNVVPEKHAFFTSENVPPSKITVVLKDFTLNTLKEYIKNNK